MSSEYYKGKPTTADIIADVLLDWNINVIFGLPGDGINGLQKH